MRAGATSTARIHELVAQGQHAHVRDASQRVFRDPFAGGWRGRFVQRQPSVPQRVHAAPAYVPSSKAQFLAVLGYDNETCTFRWIWENIDHFDASKFNFVVTDWDNVLGTKGYRVLDNVSTTTSTPR